MYNWVDNITHKTDEIRFSYLDKNYECPYENGAN